MPLSSNGLCDADSITPKIAAHRPGEDRHRRRRHRPDENDVHADGDEAGGQRGFQHVAGKTGVLADQHPVLMAAATELAAGRHADLAARSPPSSAPRLARAANAVGPEQTLLHSIPPILRATPSSSHVWFIPGSDAKLHRSDDSPSATSAAATHRSASAMACHTEQSLSGLADIVDPKMCAAGATRRQARPPASPAAAAWAARLRLRRPMKLLRDTPTTQSAPQSRDSRARPARISQVVVERLPEADARIDGDAFGGDAGAPRTPRRARRAKRGPRWRRRRSGARAASSRARPACASASPRRRSARSGGSAAASPVSAVTSLTIRAPASDRRLHDRGTAGVDRDQRSRRARVREPPGRPARVSSATGTGSRARTRRLAARRRGCRRPPPAWPGRARPPHRASSASPPSEKLSGRDVDDAHQRAFDQRQSGEQRPLRLRGRRQLRCLPQRRRLVVIRAQLFGCGSASKPPRGCSLPDFLPLDGHRSAAAVILLLVARIGAHDRLAPQQRLHLLARQGLVFQQRVGQRIQIVAPLRRGCVGRSLPPRRSAAAPPRRSAAPWRRRRASAA